MVSSRDVLAPHELFERALGAIGQPVFVKDSAFRWVFVNQAFLNLVGHSDAILGKGDFDLFPATEASVFRANDQRVFVERTVVVQAEEFLTDARGEVHVLRTVKAPVVDPKTDEVTHLIGIITDVTSMKQAESELRARNEDLERRVDERTRLLRDARDALLRKERLAVLGQLAGGLAHQIRNPLGTITTAASILRKRLTGSADPDVRHALAAIMEEVWEANRIVTDLLDFVRVRPPAREVVSAFELIETAIARSRVPDEVRVETSIPRELQADVDPRQTSDALANVIRNACEAMPDGGIVEISARTQGSQVELHIRDHGVGIPDAAMGALFEPLVTSKALGLGLGLSTARLLIENQGGTVHVTVPAGGGSEFVVSLPTVWPLAES